MLAQSGKAAANIKGMTIQSALSIGINTSKYIKLQGEKLLQLIKNFDEIEYICIDEISLVNKGLLAYLEKRLREVKQKKKGGQDRDIIFSNVNIIVSGDWSQLFPVRSDPLFYNDRKKDSVLQKEGKRLYDQFKDCINLEQQMRQNYTEPNKNLHTKEEFDKHKNQKD